MPYLNNEVLRSVVAGNATNGLVNGGNDGDIFIKDSKGLKSGNYSKDRIKKLVAASKAMGVNPYQALAIALQEEAFGKGTSKTTDASRGRRNRAGLGNVSNNALTDDDNEKINELSGKGYDYDSLRLVAALRNKLAYAKQLGYTDPALQLQSYNGYGTLTPKLFGGSTKAYGVDITNGIDLKKNPLYGKRILQLMSDLSNNQNIADLAK